MFISQSEHIYVRAIGTAAHAFVATAALAATPVKLRFVTYAPFFSYETHRAKPLDPQVFTKDPPARAAFGPKNIRHEAGFRPALIAEAPSTPLFTAPVKPLRFTIGQWPAAKGTATVTLLANGHERTAMHFSHPRPNAMKYL